MVWDVFATLTIAAAVGLLVWDQGWRGLRPLGRTVALIGVVVAATGGWLMADGNPLGLLVGIAGGALVEGARSRRRLAVDAGR